jgi:predicted peroxiredoxin
MKDLGKLINKMIDKAVVGCDKYVHNDSTWLIFTDEKKWIIELTKDGTLWYNYNFFKNLLKVLSLDVVENQNYITKWVEDTIISGVKYTGSGKKMFFTRVEETIINGVKETFEGIGTEGIHVEDVIQTGVRSTCFNRPFLFEWVEDTIKNGVKETYLGGKDRKIGEIKDIVENGVKEVKTDDSYRNYFRQSNKSEQVIEDGVKLTEDWRGDREPIIDKIIKETVTGSDKTLIAESVIKNGIKETKTPGEDGDIMGTIDFMSDNNTNNLPQLIDNVIKNGVKRTEGGVLFDETKVDRIISEGVKETKGGGYLGSIEMKGKIVHQIESPKQNNEVEDVIEHGVKLTNSSLQIDGSCVVEDVIQNGIKETHDDVYHHKGRVDGVIRNGIKETLSSIYPIERVVEKVIEVGVLEVKPAYKMIYNPMNFEPVMIEDKRIPDITDVIRDGIKETKPMDEWVNTTNIVGKVINNGVKETKITE